ncbi:hypothetical protein D3C86_1047950 [compost metagenome]
MPAPDTSSDRNSSRLLLMRPSSKPASGPATNAASGSGRMKRADWIGDMPSTSCSRWLNTSSIPSSAAAANSAAATAELKAALRKMAKSISGCGRRRWRRTKTVSMAAPPAQASPACSHDVDARPSSFSA